jgi:hypothetical protein
MATTVLRFNHGALINLGANVGLDFEPESALPQQECDLSVEGIGNFASGNYTQLTGDVNDITSNFELSISGIEDCGFYLKDPTGTGVSLSNYGSVVHATSDNLEIKAKKSYGNVNTATDREWFANLQTMNGLRSNVSDATKLNAGKANAGPGAVLVQAAAAALFKQLGKHAALNNDKEIQAKQTPLATSMSSAFAEVGVNYSDSKVFKRYLESGRYAADGPDVNTVVNYDVTSTVYDFIVQLSGNVNDADSDDVSAAVSTMLGVSGTDTKVDANGAYKFNVYMRLNHQSALVVPEPEV